MTIEYFNKVTLPLLKAFVKVRTTNDLSTLKDEDIHSKKGKP